MKEQRIKEAFEKIEPAEGARERIYRNVMQKASASSKPGKSAYRWLLPLAACLMLVLGIALAKSPQEAHIRRPVAVGSPVMQVDGPDALAPSGVLLNAPEGAEDVSYHLISGQIAKVHFTLHGTAYDYLASAVREDDFSFVDSGQGPEKTEGIFPGSLSRSEDGVWKGELEIEGAKAYILNYSGAGREDMVHLLKTFAVRILQ